MDPGKAYNSIRVKNSIPVLAASAKMQCRTGIFCRQETGNRRQVETGDGSVSLFCCYQETENRPLSPFLLLSGDREPSPVSLRRPFSIPRRNGEQMDFRGGGIRGIKAEVFFYYHSIIKRKQTQTKQAHPQTYIKSNKSRQAKAIIHFQKTLKEE